MDKVEALRIATEYNDKVRHGLRIDKSEAARNLVASGLFSLKEISYLLDTSFASVERDAGLRADMVPNNTGRLWNIHSVGALYQLALNYRAGGHVNTTMLRLVMGDNNSVRAVHELTDIPKERIREVMSE